jgi:hypothetical protein
MKAPYTIFGQTKQILVVTYTDGKLDTSPKTIWHKEMWIEREEDWYGLPTKGTVRIVERKAWMKDEPYDIKWR